MFESDWGAPEGGTGQLADTGMSGASWEEPGGFGTGIGGSVGGEVHIDGTPFRVATFVIGFILVLVVFNQGGFRFHVTV
jgi:hypothetical protein